MIIWIWIIWRSWRMHLKMTISTSYRCDSWYIFCYLVVTIVTDIHSGKHFSNLIITNTCHIETYTKGNFENHNEACEDNVSRDVFTETLNANPNYVYPLYKHSKNCLYSCPFTCKAMLPVWDLIGLVTLWTAWIFALACKKFIFWFFFWLS